MALPSLKEDNFQQIKLPSAKKLGIRRWRIREEKELLFATENHKEDKEFQKQEIIKLLGKCVDNYKMFTSLSETDVLFLAMELRKISKGETIEYSYKCPKCGGAFPDEINMKDAVKVKAFDGSPITIGTNFVFSIKEVSFMDKAVMQVSSDDSQAKFNYLYLIGSIEAITFKGTPYTNFTKDELIEFIDDMDSNDFNELYDELSARLAAISVNKEIKCLGCGGDVFVTFQDMYDFFLS